MYISNSYNYKLAIIILIVLGNREQTALVLVLVLYVICFVITMMSAWEKQYSPSGSVPVSYLAPPSYVHMIEFFFFCSESNLETNV
jgi:hypothetical protein